MFINFRPTQNKSSAQTKKQQQQQQQQQEQQEEAKKVHQKWPGKQNPNGHFSPKTLAGWPDALAILSKKTGDRDGIPLDVYACGAVIRACEQNGQWGAALEALHYALEVSLKVGMFNGWVRWVDFWSKMVFVKISKQTKKLGGMVGFSGWKGLVWWSLELFCRKMMIGCCVCEGTLMKCKGVCFVWGKRRMWQLKVSKIFDSFKP